MEIVTSWMQKGIEQGIERGIERGIEQGIEQGEQKIVKILLTQRFNNIDSVLESRIDCLSAKQIESLASVIFNLQSLEDLINWLDQQKSSDFSLTELY